MVLLIFDFFWSIIVVVWIVFIAVNGLLVIVIFNVLVIILVIVFFFNFDLSWDWNFFL